MRAFATGREGEGVMSVERYQLIARMLLSTIAVMVSPHAAWCQPGPAATPAETRPPIDFWSFKDLPYYEPLKADPRAARMMLVVPAVTKEFPHSQTSGSRRAWQITLGRELPIVGLSSEKIDDAPSRGHWGFGLWIPVSFHMIEDFKDDSAPIVDTDYRFGFMTKFQYGLSENTRLGVRLTPWAHESTHLGDEYTIFASTAQPGVFERVNVSFEYVEYGVSVEHILADIDGSIKLRHGGIKLHGKDGYYSDHLLGSDVPTLTPSVHNYEPSLGFESRTGKIRNRDIFVSLDSRYKAVYAFHRPAGEKEMRQWSHSLAVGLSAPDRTAGLPLRDVFLSVYRGVNPYGQLRTQKDFWSFGLGFTFGI
jgi:hypothetical protein